MATLTRRFWGLAALVAAACLSGCAGTPEQTLDACALFEDRPGWYKDAKKARKRWGAPIPVQLAIIQQESGFDADARPKRGKFLLVFPGKRPSSAYGYAQAVDSTWDWYRQKAGRPGADRDNFGDASDFVSWYVNQTRQQLGVSPSDARRNYLAYHEGHGDYRRGTHRKKSWLLRRADAVQRRANAYDAQLIRCEKRLNRGIPLIPFV
ncbi:MAG: transglycosylase SLT domain-containing protein [Pseudomonadota bacterium]